MFLLVLLLSFLCTDFYRAYAGFSSSRFVWILRLAEVLVAMFFGYFFALFISVEVWTAVLIGLIVAVAVFLVAFFCCDKGLIRDIVDAKLLELVSVMERWKSNFIKELKDTRETLKKDVEAEISVHVDETRRDVEKLVEDVGVRLGNHAGCLEERLKAVDNILSKLKSEAETFSINIKEYSNSLSKLQKICKELGKAQSAATEVYAKLSGLTTELSRAIAELTDKISTIGASTPLLKERLREKIVDTLKRNGLDVIEGRGRNEPNLIAKLGDKTVFAATLRAYKLSGELKQRRINIRDAKERNFALKHGVDLVIFVGNVINNRVAACIISGDELKTRMTIDTPLCLVEEGDEAAEECRKSFEELLKRYTQNPHV